MFKKLLGRSVLAFAAVCSVSSSAAPNPLAMMTSPIPGTLISGSSATFSWTSGIGVTSYQLLVGTQGAGSSNVYLSPYTTATSASVTGIPQGGGSLYVRLRSFLGGGWQFMDYIYTESGTPAAAVLSSPTPGSKLGGASANFSWTPGNGVTVYQLLVGTQGPHTTNVFDSGYITATSASVSSIPTGGGTLYVALRSYINGAWQSTDYTYIEAGTPAAAVLSSPAPGGTLPGSGATFSWTPGNGVTVYQLLVGTQGANTANIFTSSYTTATSASVTGIPTGGGRLYVELRSYINGAWQANDYTYTESGTASPAQLTSPTPGTAFAGSSANFVWTQGSGVTAYHLMVGTSGAGSSNLLNAPYTTSNSWAVSGIPTGGATVYARLRSYINGVWQFIDYTYTEAAPPAPLTLPAPNPSSLPSATAEVPYAGAINAVGGVAGYTWSINGVGVPTNGAHLNLTDGLYVTNTGGNTLSVGGTPTDPATVNLINVQVRDSLGAVASNTYAITVNAQGSQVSGQISLSNNCGNGVTLPPMTLSINTVPAKQVTSDSEGQFQFSGIPAGTWTITPSITGPSSLFSPATRSVTVSGNDVNGMAFSAQLGYTVSGTVAYAGAKTGTTYIFLTNGNCSGSSLGTSIAAPGDFTVQGVPPGDYNLTAGMDTLGFGYANASDPTGTTENVVVTGSNLTGRIVTMADPSDYTLSTGPGLNGISATDTGVVIAFDPITSTSSNGNKTELPISYTLQWSASADFSSPSSYSFKAGGADGTGVWFLNNGTNGMTGTFANGTPYYFRARGVSPTGNGPWTVYGGATTPTAVTPNAPTGGNVLSGAVTFSGTATGPLMVGVFDQDSGHAYATRIANPVSPQKYTVQVPTGSNYFFFVILDQNNDGMIDSGDMSNTGNNNTTTAISGDTTLDLTLSTANSTAKVTTQHWQQITPGGTSSGYSLNFEVRQGIKLPVAVQLISGPNIIHPIDLAKCVSCGSNQFQYYASIGSSTPVVGDTYTFQVSYADGSPETVQAGVTAALNAFATNLAPITGSSNSTTPTFTWTDPANASNYSYQFWISGNNGNIWQIPGNNSNSDGFSSSITSITWGTDPTGGGSLPSVGSLTPGTNYVWQIQVRDSDGNSTQTQVSYQP